MRKYFRQAGYFAAILILLPYVVTILLNGTGQWDEPVCDRKK